ncbi:MAG: folate-binding protein YgfZ, partial [Sinobacterium sp.]|nr:folate-binding protein YgfZ [Sinobacterium sp.]
MWPPAITDQITTYSPAAAQAFFCPLLSFSVIEVKGEEAAKFLQGQLSCDVNLVSKDQFSLGTHNTPKGRMISSFRIFSPEDNCYWLLLDKALSDTALKALQKYIVFSKASIHKRDDLLAYISQGSSFSSCNINALEQQQRSANGIIAQISTDQQPQTLLHISTAQSAIEQLTACNETLTDESALLELQHEQGLAFVCLATSDSFIAPMFNYQNNSAINFKKGCYTGQEIIARTHYKGSVKRTIYAINISTNLALNAGDELSLKKEDGQLKTIATVAAATIINNQQ